MTIHDVTIDKIRQLSEPLAQEVNDFVDFLVMKNDNVRWQLWTQFAEALEIGETDFSDYRRNLEDYEELLAQGKLQW